jgi:hypothetical protein
MSEFMYCHITCPWLVDRWLADASGRGKSNVRTAECDKQGRFRRLSLLASLVCFAIALSRPVVAQSREINVAHCKDSNPDDLAAAKKLRPDIAEQFAKWGMPAVRP